MMDFLNPFTLDNLKQIAELLANAATFLGIPIAITVYRRERQQEREEREDEREQKELATYSALHSSYINFLKLCVENLDFPLYSASNSILTAEQQKKRLIMFEILVSMAEQAFYMYRNHATEFKAAQWSGWHHYMREWCERDDFRKAWEDMLGYEYDTDFVSYINSIISDIDSSVP